MSTNKLNPQDYIAKRFGLKYDPPQIILEYLVPSTGKLYHHKIKLDFMSSDSNVSDVLDIIQKKHNAYFTNNKITSQQVEKLIYKMKEYLPKKPIKQIENKNQINNYKIINENNNQYLAQQPQTSQIPNKGSQKQSEQMTSIQSLLKASQNDSKSIFQKPTISQTASQVQDNKQNSQFSIISKQAKADEKGDILQNNKNIANNVSKPAAPVQVQQKKMEKEEQNQYDFSLSDYDSTEEKVSVPVKPIVQNAVQLKQQSTGLATQANNNSKQQEQKNNSTNGQNKIETKKNDFGFDDLSDLDDEEEESKPAVTQESKQITKQTQLTSKPQKQEEKDEEEEEMYEEIYEEDFESASNSTTKIDYNNMDLNKLSKEELDKHKAIMDKDFNKNQKKPGDKDFVYDKRATFVQNEENEWDEEL
ncbi:hypothetical protein ABPG74_017411 [Tetrahymena malaccensis]